MVLLYSVTKAVLPVAGLGTRMLPLSKAVPKELLPLGEKNCLQWIVEELYECGIRQILFVNSKDKSSIMQHFSDDPLLAEKVRSVGEVRLAQSLDYLRKDMQYDYVIQETQNGLGDAVACAEEFASGDPFVLALGDSPILSRSGERVVRRMVEGYRADMDFIVALRSVPLSKVRLYGVADFAEPYRGRPTRLASLVEKPDPSDAPSDQAITGRYLLTSSIFGVLRSTAEGKGGEVQLTDAMNTLAVEGRGYGLQLSADETRLDVGNHLDYQKAVLTYMFQTGEHTDEIREFAQRLLSAEGEWPPNSRQPL